MKQIILIFQECKYTINGFDYPHSLLNTHPPMLELVLFQTFLRKKLKNVLVEAFN